MPSSWAFHFFFSIPFSQPSPTLSYSVDRSSKSHSKWARDQRTGICGSTAADVLLWLWSARADTRGCQCRCCRAQPTVRSATTSRPALPNSFSTLNSSPIMPHNRPPHTRLTTSPTDPSVMVPLESSGKLSYFLLYCFHRAPYTSILFACYERALLTWCTSLLPIQNGIRVVDYHLLIDTFLKSVTEH